jgi:hypothetical protein
MCYKQVKHTVMKLDEIRNRLRNGFRPFALNLSSGERIELKRPGSIAVGKTIVVVLDKRGLFRTIDRLEIESLDDSPAVKRKG